MVTRVFIGTLCVVVFLVIQMDPVFSCDSATINQCVKSSFGDGGISQFTGIPTTSQLQIFCIGFKTFKPCVETEIADCPVSSDYIQAVRLYFSVIQYMCEDKHEAIILHASCWNKDQVQNGMDRCAKTTIINNNGPTPDCIGMQKVNQCMGSTVRDYCGEEAATVITDILQHTQLAAISPQTCDFNSVKAFRPELTSLLLALVVTVLTMYGNRLGQSLF